MNDAGSLAWGHVDDRKCCIDHRSLSSVPFFVSFCLTLSSYKSKESLWYSWTRGT